MRASFQSGNGTSSTGSSNPAVFRRYQRTRRLQHREPSVLRLTANQGSSIDYCAIPAGSSRKGFENLSFHVEDKRFVNFTGKKNVPSGNTQMKHTEPAPSTRNSLLLRLKRPDEQSWRTFVDLYTPLVFRFCVSRRLQEADALDVTQNVFMEVSRAIGDFEYDRTRGRFRSWLGTITWRQIVRFHDCQQRNRVEVDRVQVLNAEEATVDAQWTDEFNAHVHATALRRIRPEFDERTWEAFHRLWFDDQDPAEVAALWGKQRGWAYKVKFNVLQRLEEEIVFLSANSPLHQRE